MQNEKEFEVYNDAMEIFGDMLREVDEENFEELNDVVGEFQHKFMIRQLNNYKATVETEADEILADVFEYIVFHSESGNCCKEIESEDLAIEVTQKYKKVFGDFMDDDSCVYEQDGKYYFDVTFYGNYVPYWNGWRD